MQCCPPLSTAQCWCACQHGRWSYAVSVEEERGLSQYLDLDLHLATPHLLPVVWGRRMLYLDHHEAEATHTLTPHRHTHTRTPPHTHTRTPQQTLRSPCLLLAARFLSCFSSSTLCHADSSCQGWRRVPKSPHSRYRFRPLISRCSMGRLACTPWLQSTFVGR